MDRVDCLCESAARTGRSAPLRSHQNFFRARDEQPPDGRDCAPSPRGGGVGIGRSIHAGQVTVADGTELAGEKIRRVLTNDPGMGVIRHVDAGYDLACDVAEEKGVRIPMSELDVNGSHAHENE